MTKTKEIFMQMRDEDTELWESSKPQPTTTDLTLSEHSFIDFNKDDIRTVAMSVIDQCAEGHKSWADALIFSKKLNELADLIKENAADGAANELKLNGKEVRTLKGCQINEQMTGVKYNYESTGDPIWKELDEKKKSREAFLKTIKGSKTEIIEETGEVVTLHEPVKSGKLALIVKVQ